jgi:K+-sensing histidine kinase KdpD
MDRAASAPGLNLAQTEHLRNRTFGSIRRITLAVALVAFVLFAGLGLFVPKFPAAVVLSGLGLFAAMTMSSEWLARRQRHLPSRITFVLGLTVCMLVLAYFSNGVTGPFIVVLASVPVMAQLIGGERGRLWILTVGGLYFAMMALELLGVASHVRMTRLALYASSAVLFPATLIIVGAIVRVFIRQSESTLDMLEQRSRELTELTRRAEQAAQAERAAREQQQRTAQQLRQAVQHYTAFMERVVAGDYSARLELDRVGEGIESVELLQLGQRLNETVESLVRALRDLQTVQRRYVRESWEGMAAGERSWGWKYAEGGAGHSGLQPAVQDWHPTMTRAVQDKATVAAPGELALPLTLRGEVIGALSAHRDGSAEWTQDEIALIQAVTDQLAQTMDGIRLLDETQRRAARERLLREVTARVRSSTDPETVLKSLLREVGTVLGRSAFVRLGSAEQLCQSPQSEQALAPGQGQPTGLEGGQ